MNSLSLVQSCSAALGAPIVSLFKDKIEQGWVNSWALIKVRSFCCTRGTHRVTVQRLPLVQQKPLTFIRAHEFTQPCSILSLNSATMGAPSAAETSSLYDVSAALEAPIVSLFKDKIEQGWVNSCAVIKVRRFCCTRGTHSLVQSWLWTVTRCVPLVQQKLLTFITAHEFTQPCSILSLNSATMGAPSAAETSSLYELMCCYKGKKFLLH
jgi:hypothetical protein